MSGSKRGAAGRAPRKTRAAKRAKAKTTTRGAPRAGLTPDKVADAAARLVDEEGASVLSLSRLAADLGVRAPSLYSHVDNLGHIVRMLKLRGLRGLHAAVQRAAVGVARSDALRALADAQRRYAGAHPGLFELSTRVSDDDGAEVQAAAGALLDVVLAVIRSYGLDGDDALHATRAVRAATFGFIELERTGGFGMPLEIDESWRRLVDLLDRGLASP